jgi:hypothetical protein
MKFQLLQDLVLSRYLRRQRNGLDGGKRNRKEEEFAIASLVHVILRVVV